MGFDNKNIKNNVDACLFYDANDLTDDEKKALITQNMLFSPSKSTPDYNNTTTREQLATLMTPGDAAPITFVPSILKKKKTQHFQYLLLATKFHSKHLNLK